MPRPVELIGQHPSDDGPLAREMNVDSFELLGAATPTSNAEIIQVDSGRMHGRLKHATFGGLSLGFGSFSRGLLSRGVYSNEHITIGFLFGDRGGGADSRRASNLRIWSPGAEHERRHVGGTSFGAISVSTRRMSDFFGPDSRFSDPCFWQKRSAFGVNPQTAAASEEALRSIMSSFESRSRRITLRHAEFWERAILEAATAAIADTDVADGFVSSPIKLVRRTQEFLENAGSEPVHISTLTTALRTSRRSLQRAFDEVFSVSPATYLRRRRLCRAQILLKQRTDVTVADVAFLQGFSDFGRFSGYYRALFGEYPSETLASARKRRLRSPMSFDAHAR